MDQLLQILSGIGVDETIWMQLAVFIVAYIILTQLVFKPYFSAFNERTEQTFGNQDQAQNLANQTQEMKSQYEIKAQEINREYKTVFDEIRSKALKRHSELMGESKAKVKKMLDQTRAQIEKSQLEARNQLSSEEPAVSQAIVKQILGKDLV